MTRDEALMRLTVAYGHHPAVADFNIVAVNHVLDSLIQAEREKVAEEIFDMCKEGWWDSEGMRHHWNKRGQA